VTSGSIQATERAIVQTASRGMVSVSDDVVISTAAATQQNRLGQFTRITESIMGQVAV